MDTHTLELLEFDRVCTLVAGYAACSLGKRAALAMTPSRDPAWISEQQSLTTEMTEAINAALTPPLMCSGPWVTSEAGWNELEASSQGSAL